MRQTIIILVEFEAFWSPKCENGTFSQKEYFLVQKWLFNEKVTFGPKSQLLVQNAILPKMDLKKYQETTVYTVKGARETPKMHFLDKKSLFGPKVTFGTQKWLFL